MKTGSKHVSEVEFVFPIDRRQIEPPDPIIEDIINDDSLTGNGSLFVQLALQPFGAVVDVGCFIGRSSLPLAKFGRHDFIAIDGCKDSIACVKESIKRNGFTNVRAIHAVVSHSNFKCIFFKMPDSRNVIGKDIGFWRSLWHRKDINRMTTQTIDQIVGDTHCGTLLIDLGGYELAALHGAADLIARDLPSLVIKFDPQFPLDDLLDVIYEFGYEAYYADAVINPMQMPMVSKIREPCVSCDPQFVLCFPKEQGLPHGLQLINTEVPKTGNMSYDNREQLLEDTIITRYVPLTHNLQES